MSDAVAIAGAAATFVLATATVLLARRTRRLVDVARLDLDEQLHGVERPLSLEASLDQVRELIDHELGLRASRRPL